MRLKFLFALPLSVTIASAQDSPGVAAPESLKGSVMKGRAPVAKDLLKVRFPKPKSFTLQNGVQVYVLEDHRVPSVRFNLQFSAGSLFESKPGQAATTAQMLTEGTSNLTGLQIADQSEKIGASLGAGSDLDTASISAACLTPYQDTLLGLMVDVLEHPSFPKDRLDRIKFNQRSMNRQRRSNPQGILADISARVFYGGTGYAKTQPSTEEMAALTPEDLKTFHDAYYKPNGAILGVTGDVDARILKEKLEKAFAGWSAGPSSPTLPSANLSPKSSMKIYLVDRPGSAQTVLQFGSLAVAQNDPDFIPLTVANRVLGGGSSGRLFQNIREKKGYTYGAYSTVTGNLWPGIWGASASVRTEVTEPAVGEFFNEFSRLQNELVPADELNRAKRSIIGGFARTLESPEDILARTLLLVQNHLPLNYWDTYPARIEAVTPEDVQRVAKKYLSTGKVQLLAVGEREKIQLGLMKYGPIEVIDPAKLSGTGAL